MLSKIFLNIKCVPKPINLIKYLDSFMTLKYQDEIDNLRLSIFCPDVSSIIMDGRVYAYRFCFDPINDKHNFLPNIVFDKVRNIFFDYDNAGESTKCSRCGASFYTNIDYAKNKWNSLPERVRVKLGYTHIGYGILELEDGIRKTPDRKGHFSFYENEGVDLGLKFKLIGEL